MDTTDYLEKSPLSLSNSIVSVKYEPRDSNISMYSSSFVEAKNFVVENISSVTGSIPVGGVDNAFNRRKHNSEPNQPAGYLESLLEKGQASDINPKGLILLSNAHRLDIFKILKK